MERFSGETPQISGSNFADDETVKPRSVDDVTTEQHAVVHADYFQQKAERAPEKMRQISNEQFEFTNRAEDEIWKKFKEGDIDFATENFLKQEDEQQRLDVLGLMIEKRMNEEVEEFLAGLLGNVMKSRTSEDGIVVASKSQTRKELFDRILDSDFVVKRYPTLETNPSYYTNPGTITKAKAINKILAFFSGGEGDLPGRTLVASETILNVGGRLLGAFQADKDDYDETVKDKAKRQLRGLLGQSQTMLSGLAVYDANSGKFCISSDVTRIEFSKQSAETDRIIDDYVNNPIDGRGPIGKAGGYGLQDPEILRLIENVNGDPYTVIGFPLEQLGHIFEKLGIEAKIDRDLDSVYRKTWRDETLVEMAKAKITPNKWEQRAKKQFESLDMDAVSSLITESLGNVNLSIVELAANVGYFGEYFAQALSQKGFGINKVVSTDVEVRHDVRVKEVDINTIGEKHPREFNVILISYPPGPNYMDWDNALRSIKECISGSGIVIWISSIHRKDGYNLQQRIPDLSEKSKILKHDEDLMVLLIDNTKQ